MKYGAICDNGNIVADRKKLWRHIFALRFISIFVLLLFSSLLIFTQVGSFPTKVIKQAVNEADGDGIVTVDTCSGGAVPFDSEPYIAESELSVSANAAFLCTAGGQVLYAKREDAMLPMASITKVMTAMVVIESVKDLDRTVKVSRSAVGIEGSSMYLKEGDTVSVKGLLYALMLSSANDAAVALAIETAGSTDSFVSLMNEKAQTLGMISTSFTDPHGLGGKDHYTTARDYALLMSYAVSDPVFKEISGTFSVNVSVNGIERSLYNHNRLLRSYKGMVCGKTGYTSASGRTLVTAAERNGAILICVTLNAPDDWNDHKKLYDIGFAKTVVNEYTPRELAFELPVTGGSEEKGTVTVAPSHGIRLISLGETEHSLSYRYPVFAYAPVARGERVGYIYLNVADSVVCNIPLVSEEGVESNYAPNGIFDRLKSFWRSLVKKDKD